MAQKFPTIISFYTVETLYQLEIQNLIASCEKFHLETSIEGVPSFGSWELNCAYKPFFILKKLEELKKPLLWVDADGVFEQAPGWISTFTADFATRIKEEASSCHPSKVISNTIYVQPTARGLSIVRAWAKACQTALCDPKRKEEFWDQIALRDILLAHPEGVLPLPRAYAKIFDLPEDSEIADPVIVHYQASRRLKHTV